MRALTTHAILLILYELSADVLSLRVYMPFFLLSLATTTTTLYLVYFTSFPPSSANLRNDGDIERL